MKDKISLSEGNGGKESHQLISGLFVRKFGMDEPLTDSAVLPVSGELIAFTTDSYVVDPVFFPGGNIGTLAICGTVNDLAVSGAVPYCISASFIIEEGLPYRDLETIVTSMAEEAVRAGVKVVTGDTKVVEKGKCDKLFITTSGIGFLRKEWAHLGNAAMVSPGDQLILSGNLGDHALAVLGARKQLSFTSSLRSDCACLNHLIRKVLEKNSGVKFMRDVTRGGLVTVLHELSGMTGMGILLDERQIPVSEQVHGLCEILGFDPLYLANEGKVLFVVSKEDSSEVLEIIMSDSLGENGMIFGEILADLEKKVVLNTVSGGSRILDNLSGIQFPRIC
jgi:hydrogenase expression/formation protein HypE